jgi:hypothetical protein
MHATATRHPLKKRFPIFAKSAFIVLLPMMGAENSTNFTGSHNPNWMSKEVERELRHILHCNFKVTKERYFHDLQRREVVLQLQKTLIIKWRYEVYTSSGIRTPHEFTPYQQVLFNQYMESKKLYFKRVNMLSGELPFEMYIP